MGFTGRSPEKCVFLLGEARKREFSPCIELRNVRYPLKAYLEFAYNTPADAAARDCAGWVSIPDPRLDLGGCCCTVQ